VSVLSFNYILLIKEGSKEGQKTKQEERKREKWK
jgi:hypothetical protein